ncbi:MAG: hypothetical protein JXR96_20530 [Deltaproteobacteria bacterium]|nr:hypothetical protein [Deltaproteobacteria bacterium]
MRAWPLALLLAIAAWLPSPPCRAGEGSVRIRGNVVINDETYLAVLDLPADARPDEKTAALVRRKLRRFLKKAGYVLARVQVKRRPDHLLVKIDEGRVEKIVFVGVGTLKALRLKLDLSLPHHVFNKPYLQRQLARLGSKYGLKGVRYRLVPVEDRGRKHLGPQIGELGNITGHAVIPPKCRYELRIHLSGAEWDVGLDLDMGYDFPDGMEFGTRYRGASLIFDDDRWQLGARLGLKIRYGIDDDDAYLALSRAAGEVRYYTPALVGKGLRPWLWLRTDLVSRQRKDLMLEIYYAEHLEGSLNIGYEIMRGLMASIGGGAEEMFVFGIEGAGEPPQDAYDGGSWFRPFLGGRLEFVFNTEEIRRDRWHRLLVEARHYWVDADRSLGVMHYEYGVVLGFGWHDLLLGSRGAWLWGDAHFDDEEPVGGRYVRGVFGDRFHVHRVANAAIEFRFSLVRDLFKLSLYHDLAFFGELMRDVDPVQEVFRVANSGGMGFHALILDLFQLDLYYGVGVTSEREFAHGVSASLRKVF